ncbi:Pyrimidine 5'-nucleotidase YjjG [Paenibacillus konkukensis]|uniref:Phosphoserine phosphatase n=1 Tax=Paenibacillus konkukensis TaxID=2020716 RepID=A0ABY4RW28_9BACL|nr:HAD family hydrolase [Paenibacillus konkukensis]UQZ86213.1 Pyrimidine 5'-nucleotidase YjjG [Paenibacillus konkukensis]
MSKTEAIIFDLDNTLLWDERSIDEAFEAVCRSASAESGVDAMKLEQAVRLAAEELFASMEIYEWARQIEVTYLEALWGRFESELHPSLIKLKRLAPLYRQEAWTCGLRRAGVDDAELGRKLGDQFADERRNRPLVYADTFDVLNRLRGRYRLLLLTNGAPDLQQEKVDSIPGLAGCFEHIVISGTFGAGKPDPAIFKHAMGLLKLPAEQCLMVGDNPDTDIKGALEIGMPCAWINHKRRPASSGRRPTYEIGSLSALLDIV